MNCWDVKYITVPHRWCFLRENSARNVMVTLKVCITNKQGYTYFWSNAKVWIALHAFNQIFPFYYVQIFWECAFLPFLSSKSIWRLEPLGRVWPSTGPRLSQAALLPEQASATGVLYRSEWLQFFAKFWFFVVFFHQMRSTRASVVATLALATPWSLWRGKTKS